MYNTDYLDTLVPEPGQITEYAVNRIDKLRLDPPTLLINSSATWLSAHAQKISRPVSIVTAATRMRI